MLKTKLLGTGVLFALLFTACGKYEDGNGVSLIPRSERMSNTWELDEYYEDNVEVSDEYEVYELFMGDDGDATLTYTRNGILIQTSIDTDGTWVFTDNQENLQLDFNDDSEDATFEILRLQLEELWLRDLNSNREIRLREK